MDEIDKAQVEESAEQGGQAGATARRKSFRVELKSLINCHSQENGSDTPDFVLAEYLVDCLDAFDKATRRRAVWFG